MTGLRSRVKDNVPLRTALFLVQNLMVAVAAALRPPPWRRRRSTAPPDHGLAAMIRVKDEARFLPEWIAHHVRLGVEHVFVYDNNSADDLEDAVRPFVERGLVTLVRWPPVPASPSAEYDFLERFGPSCRWVCFFDADEFLVEAHPGAFAEALGRDNRPAVAVCWRYYGSSGYERIPEGLVTERFVMADEAFNRHVKVIARPDRIVRYRNSHNFFYAGGRLAVTADGTKVYGSFVPPPLDPPLMLNHYIYRSREDYERKALRGFVDASEAKERSRRLSVADAEFHRRNDVAVPLDARIVRATAELLRDLGYPSEHTASAAEAPGTSSQTR